MCTMFRRTWLALILPCLTLLAGCASMDQLMEVADVRNPNVSIKNARITGLSMEGADLEFLLKVDNPNALPLKFAGFDYKVNVGETAFAQGKQSTGVEIAARGTSDVAVPFNVKFSELFKLAQSLTTQNEFDYTIQAGALVDLPVVGERRFPTTFNGTLPIPKIPQITVAGFDIEQLSLAGAKLAMQLDIANPNAFGMDLRQLGYTLKVDNRQWLDTSVKETISLAEQGKSRITVPVQLSFLEMGTTLYKALSQSQPLNYSLDGAVTIDTQLPLLKNLKVPLSQQGTVTGK